MPVVQQAGADGTLTIRVVGRFDFAVHQQFRAAYEEVAEPPSRVIVDLADTDYLDSSALGMLLILREYAGAARITLRHARKDVGEILRIASFNKLFDLV